MDYQEKTLESKEIYHGKIINLRLDQVELPNGQVTFREVVEHPGGAAIVAVTPENKVLFVRQFRKPCETELWEIPAGKLDPGEDPEITARRELEEETGYRAESIEKILSFYTSPGFADEVIHIYFSNQLVPSAQATDDDEFLSVHCFSWSEIEGMLANGEIQDAKTLAGLLLTKARLGE